MAQKLEAAMPDDRVIGDGYQIIFRAVDPTTGADVSGVNVSQVNIDADDAGSTNIDVGNPILIGVSL